MYALRSQAPSTMPRSTRARAVGLTDAAHIIPILVDLPKMVAVDHPARSLRWERPRLAVALTAIPAFFTGRAATSHLKWFRSRHASDTHRQAAEADARTSAKPQLGMNATEAKVLTKMIDCRNVLDGLAE